MYSKNQERLLNEEIAEAFTPTSAGTSPVFMKMNISRWTER